MSNVSEVLDELERTINMLKASAEYTKELHAELHETKKRCEVSERRGAELMYDVVRDCMQRWGWQAWEVPEREHWKQKFLAEYEKLKYASNPDFQEAMTELCRVAIVDYKRKLIEACEEWCNDRRTKIVYGGLDKDALRLLEFIKTWEPGEK